MTDLSPAAQAVLTAFGKHPLHGDHVAETLMHGALPAALRVAAQTLAYEAHGEGWFELVVDAADLYAIAAELEGDGPAVSADREPASIVIDANPR
jgi:hypothetical protein